MGPTTWLALILILIICASLFVIVLSITSIVAFGGFLFFFWTQRADRAVMVQMPDGISEIEQSLNDEQDSDEDEPWGNRFSDS